MNNAIKMLLSNERHALKAINEVFHIDFEKPYEAVLIEGKTTIKQILKSVHADDSTLILVLNHTTNKYIFDDRYIVGIIDNSESVEIEFRPHYFHAEKLDTYHMKGDFREHLKRTELCDHHIIIAVDKANLNEHKTPAIDYNERYMFDPNKQWGNTIINLTTGVSFDQYRHSNKDIESVLDKSGYIVEYYREELKRRAHILKADRDKAAFAAIDHTDKVKELNIRITARKLELIEMLKTAETVDAYKNIGNALNHWTNGLSNIIDSYERMKTGVEQKTYASIEKFNDHYNKISQMLIDNGKYNEY